jgi:WD40 repeat protein
MKQRNSQQLPHFAACGAKPALPSFGAGYLMGCGKRARPFRAGLLGLALSLTAPQARAGSFSPTGALNDARNGHSAALLPNGKVLVVGGYNGQQTDRLASAELYDPASGTWTLTSSLKLGRTLLTATLLRNGKVLVAGGAISSANSTATCELYDPATGTWTSTGTMLTARNSHTATLLLDGKVLVAAGFNRNQDVDLASAELYDPTTGTWSAADTLATARNAHTATLLFDGRVLVAGGAIGSTFTSHATAELFDPATGSWTSTASMNSARQLHCATLLPNGQVLVTGGISDAIVLPQAELYDPDTGTWRPTESLTQGRTVHTATLLPNGKVLAVAGFNDFSTLTDLNSAELYDPATRNWTPTGALTTTREGQVATLLPSGQVLIVAGFHYNPSTWLSSAELYDSTAGPITLVNPRSLPNGTFQFAFTGAPNATNTVLATTNPTQPLSEWTDLGAAPEFAPGLFLFSDSRPPQSGPKWFYRVRFSQP